MTHLTRKSERQRGAFALLVMALAVALGAQIPLWRIYLRLLHRAREGMPIDAGHARAYVVFVCVAIALQLAIGVPLLLMGRSTGSGDAWLRSWWNGSAGTFALVVAIEAAAVVVLLR